MKVFLSEETTPYIKKVFDPALMTFKEYANAINSQNLWHPNTAYQYKLGKDLKLTKYNKYEILIQRIKKNGLEFELRMHIRKNLIYGKKDKNGDYIYDEHGKVLILTKDEMNILNLPSEEYSFAIFDDEKQAIGIAQMEWNATLISVVEEYKNWGFAKILMDAFESKYPGNDSGGFTSEGISFLKKYHAQKVREYLANGFYSYLIKKGHISKEKAKEIISNLPEKKTNKNNLDLNFNKPEDILLMYYHGDYVIYNKKAYDFYQTELEAKFDFLKEKIIKGHFRILYLDHSDEYNGRLQIFEYDTPEYKALLQNALIYEIVKNNIELKKDTTLKDAIGDFNKKNLDLNRIANKIKEEAKYRKNHDKYQEIETRIVEMAYSKYNNN